MDTLFKIFEKFSSRPLYFIFFGLSVCEFFQKESALKNPNLENILCLLSAMTMVSFLTWGFEWLIFRFNVTLEPHDQGDIGPTIGTAALAVYLVYAFHFLSEQPDALNLKLLTNSGFIYSTTLLLFSLESMKLRRLKQR
ncbi:hypothetical protein WEV50_000304 [Salmonella enterica]|uniref:Uncharacterized protein n=2 Tax=Salmonella enterica TaxID=28901 RepID=A0A3K8YFG5_SALER|nr:hypothetical protein [Salmonella enterica]ECJ2485352.1 hypothetical protein [Salmonella enterica subsp. houtenae]EDS0023779.1 hypothetical protein [Salmonella enterica subsp. enterica serovar Carswell]EHG4292051.1 hypothetical protein [Salmonella enterica subsp. houtenae serovar 48:g,z51:-]HBJ6816430.1 hypothetical protein [Salmonella enterica subsp. diarizonae serovar 60:r:e,n,x,z15]